MVNTSQLA